MEIRNFGVEPESRIRHGHFEKRSVITGANRQESERPDPRMIAESGRSQISRFAEDVRRATFREFGSSQSLPTSERNSPYRCESFFVFCINSSILRSSSFT